MAWIPSEQASSRAGHIRTSAVLPRRGACLPARAPAPLFGFCARAFSPRPTAFSACVFVKHVLNPRSNRTPVSCGRSLRISMPRTSKVRVQIRQAIDAECIAKPRLKVPDLLSRVTVLEASCMPLAASLPFVGTPMDRGIAPLSQNQESA